MMVNLVIMQPQTPLCSPLNQHYQDKLNSLSYFPKASLKLHIPVLPIPFPPFAAIELPVLKRKTKKTPRRTFSPCKQSYCRHFFVIEHQYDPRIPAQLGVIDDHFKSKH